nr:hypothetical protein [uncultured Blautia sp.]
MKQSNGHGAGYINISNFIRVGQIKGNACTIFSNRDCETSGCGSIT